MDTETFFKKFHTEIVQPIKISENPLKIEPEIIAKITKLPMNLRIYQLDISLHRKT